MDVPKLYEKNSTPGIVLKMLIKTMVGDRRDGPVFKNMYLVWDLNLVPSTHISLFAATSNSTSRGGNDLFQSLWTSALMCIYSQTENSSIYIILRKPLK